MPWKESALFFKPTDNPSWDTLTAQQCADHNLPAEYVGSIALGGYYDEYNQISSDDRFTPEETDIFVHFLTSFAQEMGASNCGSRNQCLCVTNNLGKHIYIPLYNEYNATGTERPLFVAGRENGICRPQVRLTNYKLIDGTTRTDSFTFDLRCVVTDYWWWSCDCSAQVYIDPKLVNLLNNFKAGGLNKSNWRAYQFRIKLYWSCWTGGAIDGEASWTLDPGGPTGWQQYAFNGDNQVNRSFSSSALTRVEIQQPSQKNMGSFFTRMIWYTGYPSSGDYRTGNVGGAGTYGFNGIPSYMTSMGIMGQNIMP